MTDCENFRGFSNLFKNSYDFFNFYFLKYNLRLITNFLVDYSKLLVQFSFIKVLVYIGKKNTLL